MLFGMLFGMFKKISVPMGQLAYLIIIMMMSYPITIATKNNKEHKSI